MDDRVLRYLHRVVVPVAAAGTGLWTLDILRGGRCLSACGVLDGFCTRVSPSELVTSLGHFSADQLGAGIVVALLTAAALGRIPAALRHASRLPPPTP
jgi:hypothetical protein